MANIDERLERIEQALTTANAQLGEVKGRLDKHDERFDQIDDRFDRVDSRFDALESDVQKLRVLGEDSAERIKLVAEVQAHHGEVLERHERTLRQIASDIEPLKVLPDFVERVAHDHENRIVALEKDQS